MADFFDSYVVGANTLGSFLNARYDRQGLVKEVTLGYSGTVGSVVVLIKR